MASANKSEKLGLSLWEETDKPERVDFVSDNEIVEKLLGEHLNSSSLHLTEMQKNFINAPIAFQDYTGNGESSREFQMPVEHPSLIVVWPEMQPPFYFDADGNIMLQFAVASNYENYRYNYSMGIAIPQNGVLRVLQSANPNSFKVINNFNRKYQSYHITYFGPPTQQLN